MADDPVSRSVLPIPDVAPVGLTVICHGDGATGWPAGRDHLFGSSGMIWCLGSAVN